MDYYQRYAQAWVDAREAKRYCDELKPRLISYVRKATDQKVRNDFGLFSLSEVPTYHYSEQVKEMEELLAERKKYERDQGIAQKESTQTLRFSPQGIYTK